MSFLLHRSGQPERKHQATRKKATRQPGENTRGNQGKKAGETMANRQKNTTQTPEKDQDGKPVEVYENEIYYFLDEYQNKWEVDCHDIDQSRWNACLIYIYNNTFKNTDKLKRKPYEIKRNGEYGNNNAYDMDTLKYILSVYIDLCFEYSKEVSINGFSFLTGISTQEIYNWANGSRPNPAGVEIYKTLIDLRETSLSSRLYSSKGNPVGILGILNHFYGWNMGQPHGNSTQTPQTIEDIQAKYRQIPPAQQDTPAQEIAQEQEETPAEEIDPLADCTPHSEIYPPSGNIPPVSESTPHNGTDPRDS